MAEEGEGKPKIEIAGKGTPMGEIRRKAQETKITSEQERALRKKEVETPEEMSFTNLFGKIVEEENDEKRGELMQEYKSRVREAEEKGYINTEALKNRIETTLKESTWQEGTPDYFYGRLYKVAESSENSARGFSGYRDNPRYEGLAKQLVITVANQASSEGIERRFKGTDDIEPLPEDEQDGWLNEKFRSSEGRERYKKRKRVAERASALGFGTTDLAKLVDTKERDRGEEDYERLRDEGRDVPAELKDVLRGSAEEKGAEYAPVPPEHYVALFKQSRYGIYEKGWEDKVDFLDITSETDRKRWALLNLEAFNTGVITANPAGAWKQVIDLWLGHSRDAQRLGQIEPDKKEGIVESEKETIAMMAVSASARAMEQSAGSADTYVGLMTETPPERVNTRKVDAWSELLLANDPEKYSRVINNPLVEYHYKTLLEDAGITLEPVRDEKKGIVKDPDTGETVRVEAGEVIRDDDGKVPNEGKINRYKMSEISTNVEEARKGRLVKYLNSEGVDYKGGFNGYIEGVLLNTDFEEEGIEEEEREQRKKTAEWVEEQKANGYSDSELWAAAKLACDAFLVEKFTRWEWDVTGKTERDYTDPEPKDEDKLRLDPYKGWGGDPFSLVVEPAFLAGRIKKVYLGDEADAEILRMIDKSFRPFNKEAEDGDDEKPDIFNDERVEDERVGKDKLVKPTALENLKKYHRYNKALFTFLGGSRAEGVPQWTPKVMQEELPRIVELLAQVYGDINKPEKDTGKHIVGAMASRILETKALAFVVESHRPGFKQRLNTLLGKETERPFSDILEFIYGPDLDYHEGFVTTLSGSRTSLVFKDNRYGAEEALKNTWKIIVTNDQDMQEYGKAVAYEATGLLISFINSLTSKRTY